MGDDRRYEGELNAKAAAAAPPRGELIAWNPVERRSVWRVTAACVAERRRARDRRESRLSRSRRRTFHRVSRDGRRAAVGLRRRDGHHGAAGHVSRARCAVRDADGGLGWNDGARQSAELRSAQAGLRPDSDLRAWRQRQAHANAVWAFTVRLCRRSSSTRRPRRFAKERCCIARTAAFVMEAMRSRVPLPDLRYATADVHRQFESIVIGGLAEGARYAVVRRQAQLVATARDPGVRPVARSSSDARTALNRSDIPSWDWLESASGDDPLVMV